MLNRLSVRIVCAGVLLLVAACADSAESDHPEFHAEDLVQMPRDTLVRGLGLPATITDDELRAGVEAVQERMGVFKGYAHNKVIDKTRPNRQIPTYPAMCFWIDWDSFPDSLPGQAARWHALLLSGVLPTELAEAAGDAAAIHPNVESDASDCPMWYWRIRIYASMAGEGCFYARAPYPSGMAWNTILPGSEISFRVNGWFANQSSCGTPKNYRNSLLHEAGHSIGLVHPDAPPGFGEQIPASAPAAHNYSSVMWSTANDWRAPDETGYTPDDRISIRRRFGH